MDIIEIIAALADNSIALILSLVVIYWNRKDTKEHADRERADKMLIMKALQENTQMLSELKSLVQRLNGK
jgi:hypothetical protein